MEITTVKDLGKRSTKLYRAGLDAIEKNNHGYAVELFRDILKRNPGVIEIREKMRDCQLQAIGGKSAWWRQLLAYLVVLPHLARKGSLLAKEDYGEALDNAEAAMTFDPTAPPCIDLMASTAEAADAPEIACEVLEFARRQHPEHIRFLDWLGQSYMELGQGRKAVDCYQKLMSLQPNNHHWQDMRQKAGAVEAMEEGKWDEMQKGETDFRAGVRDQDEAARLEQSERMVKTEVGLEKLIANQLEVCAQQPNVANYQDLAKFYTEARQWEEALAAYDKVMELSEGVDPTVREARSHVEQMQLEDAARQWEEYAGREDLAADERQSAAEEAAKLRQRKHQVRRATLEEIVSRNPTDHQHRYDLGCLLFDEGNYDEAIGHFQYNQKSAHYRQQATLQLARCFMAKEVFDLAEEQLQSLLARLPGMNDVKKQTLYALAECKRARGQSDEALRYFKQIYTVDLKFRDVREIVESASRDA